MDSTASSLPENRKPIVWSRELTPDSTQADRCFGLSPDRNSQGHRYPSGFRPEDRPKDRKPIFLTDYVILKSQCPLWEEYTDNVRGIYELEHDLMKSGLAPRGYTSFIKRVKDGPLATAWKLFRRRKAYTLVITGDTYVGLYYAMLRKLLDRGGPPQLFIDFMLDRPQANAFWRFQKRLQGYIMSKIECTVVFSKGEISVYSQILHLEPSKFHYVPYHTNILKPEFVASHQGYVFSAGRSGRDYNILLEAVKGLDVPVIIISDRHSLEGLTIPPNVKVYYDSSYDNYLQLLKNSQIVVVPLQPDIRSLGMVVMLEAMALGKPVITTRGASNVEYIRDGENGLFVNSGDWQGLKIKIQYLLGKSDECLRLGKNALADVNKYWTFDIYVRSVLDIAYKMEKLNDTVI